jgi:hypothetical protein
VLQSNLADLKQISVEAGEFHPVSKIVGKRLKTFLFTLVRASVDDFSSRKESCSPIGWIRLRQKFILDFGIHF